MDAFGDNFDQTDIDPAADFLAREKDQLAGLEDELSETIAASVIQPKEGKRPTLIIIFIVRGAQCTEYKSERMQDGRIW